MTPITAMTHQLTLDTQKITMDSGVDRSRHHAPGGATYPEHDADTWKVSNRVNRSHSTPNVDLRNLYVPLDRSSLRTPPSHRVGQMFKEMPLDTYDDAINLLRYRLYQSRRLLRDFSQTVEFSESDRRALSRAYDKLVDANGLFIKATLPMGIDILDIEEIKQAVNVKFALQKKLQVISNSNPA